MADDELGQLLAEQIAYYRARASEYLDGVLDLPGGEEIEAALDVFAPAGDVLDLACGPGTWTPRLLQEATTVTAVDAAPEMLAIARDTVGDDDRVQFVLADLFAWRPDRRYDVVFFGFWLSHVPLERLPRSGRSSRTAWLRKAGCSSLTTRTGLPTARRGRGLVDNPSATARW